MKHMMKISLCSLGLLMICGCTQVEEKNKEIEQNNDNNVTEVFQMTGIEQKFTNELEEESEETFPQETLHFIDAWDEWHDVIIKSTVPHHNYDWKYLSNTQEGIYYDGDEHYSIRKGIDVSHHQGTIQWDKVKESGYDFAIIRIGYRGYGNSGTIKMDRTARNNIINAQKAGLDVGVYFFAQAINELEAKEEAEFVLEQLKDLEIQLPVVYDPELIRDEAARTDNVTGEQFTRNTIVFCEKILNAGYEPMIYSNMVWEGEIFDMEQLKKYTFWYADYEPFPQTPYAFEYWQYSEKGTVDGIEGMVDLDIQFVEKQ